MPADVRPYLVPQPGTVTWEPWTLFNGHDWSLLPDSYEGWDTGTDLRVRRVVRIDPDRFRRETALEPAQLSITVSWTSSTTGMTEAVPPMTISPEGVRVVDALLPGNRLAGVVQLRTTLTLAVPQPSAAPGIARIPGCVLADHGQRLALEGTMSMFPVHDIDFSHTRLAPDASWHLETSTELAAPFLGTFRLLINKRDTDLIKAVARGVKGAGLEALRDELQHGVAMLLLELAVVLRDELKQQDAWPPDSVGDVLSRVLSRADRGGEIFPPAGPHDLAAFRTRLAGAVRVSGQGRAFS